MKRTVWLSRINGKVRLRQKLFGKALVKFHNDYCQKCMTSFGNQDCRYWSFMYPPENKLPKVGETWIWKYNDWPDIEYKITKIVNKKWPKAICDNGHQLILRDCAWHNFYRKS